MTADAPFRDHRLYLLLIVINVIMARIAMRLYGEHFVLLQHAISDLGATVTRGELPNRRSPWVFAVQMLASAVICFRYARTLARQERASRDHRFWLIRMFGAGFLLMPAPHNLPVTHYVHMFGGGFIFFSLWVLTMIYLNEGRRRGSRFRFRVGMILLQAGVLSYAFMFAIDSQYKQVAQGFGLLGLLGVLVWSTVGLARNAAVLPAEDENSPPDAAASI